MSSVAATYNRYSFLTEEQRTTNLSALERYKTKQAEAAQTKPAADDVAFSTQGKELAAAMSREEMEALSYSHLLEFETEDGGKVSVDLAMDPDSEEKYLAARITVTRADGTEEVLYVPFTEGEDETEETETQKTAREAAEAEAAGTAKNAVAEATEEAQPSLLELIEQYGLNKTPDASDGLFAAIRARIEAMIEAAGETAEEQEALEAVTANREARNQTAEEISGTVGATAAEATGASGTTGGGVAIGEEISPINGRMARTLAKYANSANFSMGSFSRRY